MQPSTNCYSASLADNHVNYGPHTKGLYVKNGHVYLPLSKEQADRRKRELKYEKKLKRLMAIRNKAEKEIYKINCYIVGENPDEEFED